MAEAFEAIIETVEVRVCWSRIFVILPKLDFIYFIILVLFLNPGFGAEFFTRQPVYRWPMANFTVNIYTHIQIHI